jgi:Fic family protein
MSLQPLLNRIDKLQAAIEAAGKFDPEVLKRINYKFRLDWNYHSNAMEGNSLTKEETRSVMVNNVTVEGKPLKDVLEIKGHDQVITDILKIGKGELGLSEKRIKDIHKAIIHEDDPKKKQKIGQWKTENNHLINYKDEKFDFLEFSEVAETMHQLINWLNAQTEQLKAGKSKLHPVLIAFEFHLKYLTIHPFYDGNGRTARILTNLILISFGYPPVIIKKDEKEVYYRYLADVQGYGGNPDLYYEFMCKLLIHSQELVIKGIDGESIEEPDDLDKEIMLLKKKFQNTDYTKSPKSIHETFNYIENEVWGAVEEALNSFIDFFNEGNIERFVNGMPENFGTQKNNILPFLLLQEKYLKPEDLKIFGHSIYKNDITTIKWQDKKLGLKGATGHNIITTNLNIEFDLNNYTICVIINRDKLFSKKLSYGSYINIDDVNTLKASIKKTILEKIKEYTQDNPPPLF